MKTGLFIDPSGRECPLVAGNETEFRVLVTRKLASGWRRGPNSPRVEPLTNETQVALPPVAPPAPPVLVEDPPVMAVPASVREAAIAKAQAGLVEAAATALENRGIGTAEENAAAITVSLDRLASYDETQKAITAAVRKANKK